MRRLSYLHVERGRYMSISATKVNNILLTSSSLVCSSVFVFSASFSPGLLVNTPRGAHSRYKGTCVRQNSKNSLSFTMGTLFLKYFKFLSFSTFNLAKPSLQTFQPKHKLQKIRFLNKIKLNVKTIRVGFLLVQKQVQVLAHELRRNKPKNDD